MGTAISKLVTGEPITIKQLGHKILAVDAYNMLYQFLTTIRTPDGSPLKNSKGHVTSHLIGLLSRVSTMLENQAKPVFVFDGKPPELKLKERERRRAAKEEAIEKYEAAKEAKDIDAMKKYAGRTARLTPEMVRHAKQLLEALGVPWIQAPSEGEAQAAHMVRQGKADYVVSQDMDCLLYGAPVFVKNLSISGKRKKPGSMSYYTIEPEKILLAQVLQELAITQEQLIAIGMLVGTDFNPGGIKGIGPKKALKLVKENIELADVFTQANWDETQEHEWKEIFDVIANMEVTDKYEFTFSSPDKKELHALLVEEFEFSEERVKNVYEKIKKTHEQKGLRDFF